VIPWKEEAPKKNQVSVFERRRYNMFWFFFIDVGDTYIAQVCECVCVCNSY